MTVAALALALWGGVARGQDRPGPDPEPRAAWARQAARAIARAVRDPRPRHPSASSAGRVSGRTVSVRFTVLADGTVRAPIVQRSSGRASLDAAALDAVRAASPLPPPPLRPGADSVVAALPVQFR